MAFVGGVGAHGADEDELRAVFGGEGGGGGEVFGEGVEDEAVVLLWAELGDVEEDILARWVWWDGSEGDGGDEGFDRTGWVEDFGEGGWCGGGGGCPELGNVVVCPGGVAHYNIDLTAYPAVEAGEEMPVLFLESSFPTAAGAGVDAFCACGII